MTARHLYGRDFQFSPTATFWLATNHKPPVRDDSHGFWRRIRLIPFTETFDGSARDEHLEARLLAEAPGILRWAVDGCLAWQATGLTAPAVVTAATDAYERDSDVLSDFLEEACTPDPDARATSKELFAAYRKWTDLQRVPRMDCLSVKSFGQRMGERYERGKTARRVVLSRLVPQYQHVVGLTAHRWQIDGNVTGRIRHFTQLLRTLS